MTRAEFIKKELEMGRSLEEIEAFLKDLEEDFKDAIKAGIFDYSDFSLGEPMVY